MSGNRRSGSIAIARCTTAAAPAGSASTTASRRSTRADKSHSCREIPGGGRKGWTNKEFTREMVRAVRQAVRCLVGGTHRRGSFDSVDFDEAAFVEAAHDQPSLLSFYQDVRLRAAVVLRDFATARRASAHAAAHWSTTANVPIDRSFYTSLALAGLCASSPPPERAELVSEIRENQEHLATWAAECPENFRHKHLLVEAELGRLTGQDLDEVATLYETAIEAARAQDFIHEQALASELAGRALLAGGREASALTHLRSAVRTYAAWGASEKVNALKEEFSSLARAEEIVGPSLDLDVLSILKATTAIASELDLPRLLEKLIHVCIEAAGAERAVLLLEEDGRAVVRATGSVGQPVALRHTALADSTGIPRTIVDRARATRVGLTSADASHDPRFDSDPDVRRRGVRSVLAMPLVRQTTLIGTLYFENNLTTGAFGPTPVRVLELLTTQVATSLEIGLLLQRLTREIRDRARSEAEVRFLADASSALSESLSYETTLARVTRLVVTFLADWCVVDLVDEDHRIRRVASAHADPSKEASLEEINRRNPLDWAAAAPWIRVLRTGAPLFLPTLTDDSVREYCPDDDVARLTKSLGARSGLSVPLVGRERLLGAISLVSGRPNHFGARELQLAQELARRVTMAIENARLYREARRAIEVRNEFLSIASHELYTPITSMQLAIQGIQSGAIPRTPASPSS